MLGRFGRHLNQLEYIRDLVRELVARELKLRYKRSILGVVWAILNPLSYVLIFTLIRPVLNIGVKNYSQYVLAGVVAWNWFREGLMLSVNAITGNRDHIKIPGFPLAVLPVVSVTTSLIDMVVTIPIILLIYVIGGGKLSAVLILLPVLIILQFLLILGLGYMVATMNAAFRDTKHLLGVVLGLLFFLTPIFYDAGVIPERYQFLYNLNPIVHMIAAYRAILIEGTMPDLRMLFVLAILGALLMCASWYIFTRSTSRFVEDL